MRKSFLLFALSLCSGVASATPPTVLTGRERTRPDRQPRLLREQLARTRQVPTAPTVARRRQRGQR